jgi:hypothetical protein
MTDMTAKSPTTNASLHKSPAEVKLIILEELQNARDVVSVALTSRDLYELVKAHENTLAKKCLSSSISEELLGDAINVWNARSARDPASWVLIDFVEQKTQQKNSRIEEFLQTCSISHAAEIIDHHRIIRQFASRMQESFLNSASTMFKRDSRSHQISPTETIRILRAIYRFDLYFAVFTPPKCSSGYHPSLSYEYDEARRMFWGCFAPWEIEQVACVYDWLLSILTPIYDTIALEIPSWTEWAIESEFLIDLDENFFLQAEMAQGLEYIDIMILYAEAKVDASKVPGPPTNRDPWHFHSIEDSLDHSISLPQGLPDEMFLPSLFDLEDTAPPELIAALFRAPWHENDDPGPEAVWCWAHQYEAPFQGPRSGFVLSDCQKPLREIGYVLWDQSKSKSWGLLRSYWKGFYSKPARQASAEERDRAQEKVRILAGGRTTKRRAKLWPQSRLASNDISLRLRS